MDIINETKPKLSKNLYDLDCKIIKYIGQEICKLLGHVVNKCIEEGKFSRRMKVMKQGITVQYNTRELQSCFYIARFL